ncbi:flagellar hook-associated protein FlgL [Caballeronia sordidicola]|uniref:Flagellar hook-associated protein FlgL n=1 Tax=Caballeronia sordidicola TaxID=196367 RepID=A0A242M3C4_CABSO|nr:flagellar hook-associated protein FlgL [Caballeronia sordidicola]OTP65693.1 Flagellar hook-associated protein FlgL [Caballeronia sordidicola]
MRISSSQYFAMGVQTMSDQQATLSTMYQKIASENKLQTAADDPLGAAQAVSLSSKGATLAQFSTNQDAALTALQQESSTLTSVTSVMNSIMSDVSRAGNGSLNDTDRASIAQEIKSYRTQLSALANTTDASGNHIFGGFKTGQPSFTDNPSGTGATYNGNSGVRSIQINDTRSVSTGDTGSSVFQGVSVPGSDPVPSSSSANTGTGTIGAVSTLDPNNAGNSSTYKITFSSATTYTVTASTADGKVGAPGAPTPYTAGQPILLGGESVTINGAPAANDSFSVTPANTGKASDSDIFATLDNLAAALEQPTQTSGAAATTLTNALATAGTKLNNSFNNILTVQASVGGRMQEVKTAQSSNSTSTLQNASSLSDLTSVDLPSAISQYQLTQTALQGAQQAFASIQKMSLFQYLT